MKTERKQQHPLRRVNANGGNSEFNCFVFFFLQKCNPINSTNNNIQVDAALLRYKLIENFC